MAVFGLVIAGTLFVAYDLGSSFLLPACQLSESAPEYSPDKKFYYVTRRLQCQDTSRSRAELLMGAAEKSDKSVVLELGPSFKTLQASWQASPPELHVQVPAGAVVKQSPPERDLPRVVVTDP
jgi:hypothetical protein